MLRCPLCLGKLTAESRFVRYCLDHPTARREFSVSDSDWLGIACPGDGSLCTPAPSVSDGVFLLHVDCDCTNPFLRPDRASVDVVNRKRLASGVVQHWQVSRAEEIARLDNRREMWFPQALFRAMNELSAGRPMGCLVMLAGAQSVGKTVLSLMAMCPTSYSSRMPQHFVHITETGASNEDYLTVLDALQKLSQDATGFSMMPTSATHVRNIKAVFFAANGKPGARLDRRGDDVTLKSVVRSIVGDVAERLDPGQRGAQPFPPTHDAVAFHDISGETWQNAAGVGASIVRSHADVQAVVADLSSFSCFGSASRDNAWVAREQLDKASEVGGRRCLVVTKLDLALARAIDRQHQLASVLSSVRDAHRSGAVPRVNERAILEACLKDATDPSERRLWRSINGDPHLPVFFVWTEGLGSPAAGRLAPNEVRAYGMEPFVDWCLAHAMSGEIVAKR